jgi:hypothetical protein
MKTTFDYRKQALLKINEGLKMLEIQMEKNVRKREIDVSDYQYRNTLLNLKQAVTI